MGGEGEPALDVEAVVVPLDGDGFGEGLGVRIEVGDLVFDAVGVSEDLRWGGEAGFDEGEGLGTRGDGGGVFDGASGDGGLAEIDGGAVNVSVFGDVVVGKEGAAAAVFDDADAVVVEPDLPAGGAVDVGSDVGGVATFGVDDVDVAAGRALVGHEAADEGDVLAVGRVAGDGDLQAVEGGGAGVGIEDDGGCLRGGGFTVELGDPPGIFSGRVGGDERDLVGGWSEVELVDVELGGGEPFVFAGGDVDGINALDFYAVFADDAGPGLHGVEGSGGAGGVFDEEEGDGLAVGGPGWLLKVAGQVAELLCPARGFGPEEDLLLCGLGLVACAGGEEGEGLAVRGPDGRGIGAVGCGFYCDDL